LTKSPKRRTERKRAPRVLRKPRFRRASSRTRRSRSRPRRPPCTSPPWTSRASHCLLSREEGRIPRRKSLASVRRATRTRPRRDRENNRQRFRNETGEDLLRAAKKQRTRRRYRYLLRSRRYLPHPRRKRCVRGASQRRRRTPPARRGLPSRRRARRRARRCGARDPCRSEIRRATFRRLMNLLPDASFSPEGCREGLRTTE